MELGFIGLGIMGEAMAANLLKKSEKNLIVFDLSKEKMDKLKIKGATVAKNPKEVVRKSDIIFTCLPKSEQVKELYEEFHNDIRHDHIFIEMSTIDPDVSISISKQLAQRGAAMLDSPVVKSKQDAINGTLGIYIGGDIEVLREVQELLECIGEEILYMGPIGSGITMKICANMLLGEIQNGVNETLILADKYGIDIRTFRKAISMGGANNAYINAKAENIEKENYDVSFSVSNMKKDVSIAKKMKNQAKLKLPGLDNINNIYNLAVDDGLENLDIASTFEIVKKLSGFHNDE